MITFGFFRGFTPLSIEVAATYLAYRTGVILCVSAKEREDERGVRFTRECATRLALCTPNRRSVEKRKKKIITAVLQASEYAAKKLGLNQNM